MNPNEDATPVETPPDSGPRGMVRPYPSLLAWRRAQHLSQRGAASRLGISQTKYARIERKEQPPRPAMAKRIMDLTGVPLEELLGIVS